MAVGGALFKNGIHLDLKLTSPDTYVLVYDSPADPSEMLFGTPQSIITGNLLGTSGAPISQLAFDRTEFGGEPHAYTYINNVAVTPEPSTPAIVMLAAISILRSRRR